MPTSTRARGPRAAAAVLLLLLCAACAKDPVTWDADGDRRVPLPPPSATNPGDPATDRALVLRSVREAVGAPADDDARAGRDPSAGRACPGSLAVARGAGAQRAAVWWEPRGDGSANLLSALSADAGATWERPIPVDTLDRGTMGCDRPAPSIALDSAFRFTHVAYSMTAPEGKGVFYAHRMGADAPFEPPLVVVYGDRPAATSVASRATLVVVAYEDPNVGDRSRISLALSRASGHLFDERLLVSGTGSSAVVPQVALRDSALAVGWIEHVVPRLDDPSRTRAETAAASRAVIVRRGTVR